MRKSRTLPAKSLVQHYVKRSAGQPFFATNYMGNFHEVIINHIGQVVGWHAIALKEHLVIHIVGVHANPTANNVLKLYLMVARQFHADYIRLTFFQSLCHLCCGQGERVFHAVAGDVVVLPVGIARFFG